MTLLVSLLLTATFHNVLVLAESSSSFATSTSSSVSPAASAAAPLNESLIDTMHAYNCQAGQVYTHPDSAASYSVLAIEDVNGVVVNSSKSWNLTAAVSQVKDIYTTDGSTFIQQDLFLDTSSTISPTSNDTSSPIAACAFVLSLPVSIAGKLDKGDCTSVLSQQCVMDLRARIASQALIIARQKDMFSGEACDAIASDIIQPPASCNQYNLGTDMNYQYFDVGSEHGNYTNCTNAPPSNPINFYSRTFEPQVAGDNTTVAQQARTVTPVLFALFSNATTYSGPAFGDSRLICTTPGSASSGSVTSGGEHSAAAGFSKAAIIALAFNALVFFLL